MVDDYCRLAEGLSSVLILPLRHTGCTDPLKATAGIEASQSWVGAGLKRAKIEKIPPTVTRRVYADRFDADPDAVALALDGKRPLERQPSLDEPQKPPLPV